MFGENVTLQIGNQTIKATDFKIIGTVTSDVPCFDFKPETITLTGKLISDNRRGIYQILLPINTYIVFDKKLKKTLRIYRNKHI
jgi:hypothetical protein